MSKLLVVAVSVGLLLPAAANGATRAGAVSDPDDVRQSLNPPNMPDVEQVRVNYDEAGSVTITTRWYEDVRQRPTSDYSTDTYVILGQVGDRGCDYIDTSSDRHYFQATVSLQSATGSVDGYEGSLSAASVTSGDGRETSATFTHSALAGRDYQCVVGGSETFVYSSASDPDSHYSPSCDCWYRYSFDDSDDWADFNFPGYPRPAPSPPPPTQGPTPSPYACSDGKDNDRDGLTDLDDPGCLGSPWRTTERDACSDGLDNDGDGDTDASADPGCLGRRTRNSESNPTPLRSSFRLDLLSAHGCRIDTGVEVLPDLRPLRLFPWRRVRITVRGVSGKARGYRREHRPRLNTLRGYAFTGLRPGRYVVAGYYPGDRYRLRSHTARRRIVVSRRVCDR